MSSFAPGTPIEVMNAVNQRWYGITPTQTTNNGLPQGVINAMNAPSLGGQPLGGVSTGQLTPEQQAKMAEMRALANTMPNYASVYPGPQNTGTPSGINLGGLLSGALTNLGQTPAFQGLGQVATGQQPVPEWIRLAMQSGNMNNPYAAAVPAGLGQATPGASLGSLQSTGLPMAPTATQTSQPYTPPNYGNYGFDQSMVDYLNRQRQLSAYDAGIAYNYDPATQTFTGSTMGGPVTKTLAQMQAEIANQRVPNFPPVGQQTTGGLGSPQSTGGMQARPTLPQTPQQLPNGVNPFMATSLGQQAGQTLQAAFPNMTQEQFSSIFGSQPVSQQPVTLAQAIADMNKVNPGAINPAVVNPVRQPLPVPANLSQAIENVRRPQPSWQDRFNALRNRTKFSSGIR